MKLITGFITAIGVIVLIAEIALLLTFLIMWALNYVFTPAILMALFGIPKLTFWKTFVLYWVIAWLFKSTAYSSSK